MADSKNYQRLLYLTFNVDNPGTAHSINTKRRKAALEALGFRVELITPGNKNVFSEFYSILKKSFSYSILYIRIDGAFQLDLYTLIKLFNPSIKIIWELHGFPEEVVFYQPTIKQKLSFKLKNICRKNISVLVQAILVVSYALQVYTQKKLGLKNIYMIPNFADESELNEITNKQTLSKFINTKDFFIVLWAGNPGHKWHAVDIIESVAKQIFAKDKRFLFIIIGPESWHTFTWHKNLIHISEMPHTELLKAINVANVCLILYNKMFIPPYFSPLKIFDYMLLKKPIIASNTASIREILKNNENCLLINNSVQTLTKKLLWLKNNPEKANTLGQNSYKIMKTKYNLVSGIENYRKAFTAAKLIQLTV